MDTDGAGSIGLLCADDQPVFAAVADRLRNADFSVRFFEPRTPLPPTRVEGLSVLVNKQVFPVTLPALEHAWRNGIPIWNPLPATIALGSRLIGLCALESVGFRTPRVSFERPDGEYVAKNRYVWDGEPELNGDGEFYQELVPTEPVDWKYYAVDDGARVRTAARRVTSKLYGPKRFLGRARTRPALARRLRVLLERTGLRGVGVDLVRDDAGRFWAVDVNLAAGYRNTGLETALAESIRASLPGDR